MKNHSPEIDFSFSGDWENKLCNLCNVVFFVRLKFSAVGQIAGIAQSRDDVHVVVQFRVDGPAP